MAIDRANLRALCVRLTAAPVDIASLAFFRILFGLVMTIAMSRFLAKGWVLKLYVEPTFHFAYPGLEWIRPLPAPWMHMCFILLAILAAGVALGWFYRVCIVLFFLGFTYVELIDQTAYLNHYYLISLLSGLLIFLPANHAWSIDARRKPKLRSSRAPAWALNILRLQVSVVYLFAGLAKLNSDWLLQAQPLRIWLAARGDLPFIGPILETPATAYAASWFGAIFDLTIVFFLLWHTTRRPAYVCLVLFHVATAILFNIGMFPWIMIASATLLFPADWPRALSRLFTPLTKRLFRGSTSSSLRGPIPVPHSTPNASCLSAERLRWGLLCPLGLYAALQLLVPLRPYLATQPAAWTSSGFNCAWQVMIVEKTGFAEFFACDPSSGRRWKMPAHDYLTPRQELMMAQDPYLIRQLARRLARDLEARGHRGVQIKVDAFATLNGRPSQRLVDPRVDLAGTTEGDWILPLIGLPNRASQSTAPEDNATEMRWLGVPPWKTARLRSLVIGHFPLAIGRVIFISVALAAPTRHSSA